MDINASYTHRAYGCRNHLQKKTTQNTNSIEYGHREYTATSISFGSRRWAFSMVFRLGNQLVAWFCRGYFFVGSYCPSQPQTQNSWRIFFPLAMHLERFRCVSYSFRTNLQWKRCVERKIRCVQRIFSVFDFFEDRCIQGRRLRIFRRLGHGSSEQPPAAGKTTFFVGVKFELNLRYPKLFSRITFEGNPSEPSPLRRPRHAEPLGHGANDNVVWRPLRNFSTSMASNYLL